VKLLNKPRMNANKRESYSTPIASICVYLWPIIFALTLASCGYHVAGKTNLVPKSIHTICIPPFANITTRYKITDQLAQAVSREFITRTRYQIVNDPDKADAVLRGAVVNYVAFATLFDQKTGRASGFQANLTMQITFTERATGKVIFSRPSYEMHQRYEVSIPAPTYFDESDAGLARLSHDVARDLVTAILENF